MADIYLDTAVDRLVEMYKLVLATMTPTVHQVVKYIDPGLTPPLLWLYPGPVSNTDINMQRQQQLYAINARLVLGTVTDGYDGVLASKLWTLIPTTLNYFMKRRNLVYQAGQTAPLFLEPSKTTIALAQPFGTFNASNQVGVEFQHTLLFLMTNDQSP